MNLTVLPTYPIIIVPSFGGGIFYIKEKSVEKQSWFVGLAKFLGLILFCSAIAILSVVGLHYKVAQPETKWVMIYEVNVSGTDQTISDMYGKIGPEGPIKPYDLVCAAKHLRGLDLEGKVVYEFDKVIFPAWFHAPGGWVSDDVTCSLDGHSIRTKYPQYKEIGS